MSMKHSARVQGTWTDQKSYAFAFVVFLLSIFFLGLGFQGIAQTIRVDLGDVPHELRLSFSDGAISPVVKMDLHVGHEDEIITGLLGFRIELFLHPDVAVLDVVRSEENRGWFLGSGSAQFTPAYDPQTHAVVLSGVAMSEVWGGGTLVECILNTEGEVNLAEMVVQSGGSLLMIDNLDIRTVSLIEPIDPGISHPGVPNWGLDHARQQLHLSSPVNGQVQLVDLQGRQRYFGGALRAGGSTLDLAGLEPGIYIARLLGDNGRTWFHKILLY